MVDIPTTQLEAGRTYVIRAFMPGLVTDYVYTLDSFNASFYGLRIDPRVQFVAMRQSFDSTLTFPSTRFTDYFGMFGPCFAVEVPEPRTLSLVVLTASFVLGRKLGAAAGDKARPRSKKVRIGTRHILALKDRATLTRLRGTGIAER